MKRTLLLLGTWGIGFGLSIFSIVLVRGIATFTAVALGLWLLYLIINGAMFQRGSRVFIFAGLYVLYTSQITYTSILGTQNKSLSTAHLLIVSGIAICTLAMITVFLAIFGKLK